MKSEGAAPVQWADLYSPDYPALTLSLIQTPRLLEKVDISMEGEASVTVQCQPKYFKLKYQKVVSLCSVKISFGGL